ncbi:MAG: BatD family protein [Bacteroidia bacterium]
MLRIKYLFVLIALFLFDVNATAQDPAFTASVNNNPVSVGQQFQLSFRIEGSGKNFQPPSLSDFQVLSGPNQSTSKQYINGNKSQSLTYSFILVATKEGTFRIGPASIEANGIKIISAPLNITVRAGASSQGGSSGGQGDDNIYKQLSDNIFIVASLDKTNVYKGEPVIVTYKLYTRLNLVNYGVSKVPPFTGFWAKDISLPQQLQFKNEPYNGIIFRTADVKQTVLFPQQSGTITIDPMEAEVIARVQSKTRTNNPFDRFFNDPFFSDPFSGWQDLKHTMKSQALKVNVKELPSANVPAGFNGTVGKFNLETSIDHNEVQANDPITLKVKISGRGNFDLIQPPNINFPPNMEVYDPKISDNINITGNGISGSKTFEYLIIPRIPGEYVIEPFGFYYFDLDKMNYQVLNSTAYELKIRKGSGQMTTTVDPGSRADFQLLGRDILFIKTTTPEFKTLSKTFFASAGFYTLVGAPVLLFLGLLFYRRRQEDLSVDVVSAKRKGATAMARKRLAKAKQFMQQNKKEEFYEEVQKALWGYLGYKLSINVSDLSRENVKNELLKHSVNTTETDEMVEIIDRCEFARYAPPHEDEAMENVYSSATEIITKIEQQIR